MMAQNHFLQRKAKKNYTIDLFVVFRPTRELFTSYGDVTIAGEGVQILTYARHSWLLSSYGSLACHIYCDT